MKIASYRRVGSAEQLEGGKPMNNLQYYRKRAGLTQAALAEKVEISIRTLQDYEQDRKPLEGARAITVLNMARCLGCTVEDLIDREIVE